jgi:hypothetical protein
MKRLAWVVRQVWPILYRILRCGFDGFSQVFVAQPRMLP